MASTTFVQGTVIPVVWLNDVNAAVYGAGTPTNGQINIGNGTGFSLNTITAGSNITITNGAGTITIAATSTAPFTGGTLTSTLNYTQTDKGTVGTGTVTFTASTTNEQRLQVSGALTVAFTGWPTSGIRGYLSIKMVNWGSAVVTLPTINWQLPTGGFTTTFATYLTAINRTAFQSSGTDFGVFWSDDAGTTVYGKLV